MSPKRRYASRGRYISTYAATRDGRGRLERANFGTILEEAWQTVEGERFPFAELDGMDTILSGELRDRLLLLEV